MKCEYVGWYSRRGCNEEAEPGERYCHAHREQGKNNETSSKIVVGCFLAALGVGLLFVVCVVAVAV